MNDRQITIAISALIAIGVALVIFLFLHLGGFALFMALLIALVLGAVLMAALLFAAWGRDGMPPEVRDRLQQVQGSWGPMRDRMSQGVERVGQSVGPMAERMGQSVGPLRDRIGERVSPLREKIGEVVSGATGSKTADGDRVTREDRAAGIQSAGVMTRPAAAGPGGVAPGAVVPGGGAPDTPDAPPGTDHKPDAMRRETQEQARREWSGGEAAEAPVAETPSVETPSAESPSVETASVQPSSAESPSGPETRDAAEAVPGVPASGGDQVAPPVDEDRTGDRPGHAPAPPSGAASGGTGGAARKPGTLDAPREDGADDLKRIRGIGPKLEEMLHGIGVWHFDQIAAWSSEEVAWVDDNIEGFKGRVTRDDWVAQARTLAGGEETAFSKRMDEGDVH